jgi:S-DNA-T family DNA segregation ATPase FtsK/SpoIIIE
MGALHAKSLRIEAPIPGENHVGIEVPNRTSAGISFREIIESGAWRDFKGELPLLFGKDAAGKELVADLAKMPHMLVAGATGQGKSVCLNSIINGLLMTKTPEQLKFIMVDPKSVEFTPYASIPHLLVPVITDNNKASGVLALAVAEMEKRLKLFARARVRNIYDFNHRPQFTQTNMFGDDTPVGGEMQRTLPYIVIIIDEVADLMAAAAKVVTPNIARLTAKARAAGIHVILATQRPDAKVITGTVKANIPGRVAFKTATGIDSRTILDEGGAENLIGKGDMLFRTAEGMLVRAQGAWISDDEITRITQFIEQHSNVEFDETFNKKLSKIKEASLDGDDESEDEETDMQDKTAEKERVKAEASASDFKKAVECIINTNRASTSHFQRRLGWGYNHAAKIMDMLEEAGVIAAQQGAGPRQIMMDRMQLMEVFNGGDAVQGDDAGENPADETAELFTEENQ